MKPLKFRKKPDVVEAMKVRAYTEMLPPARWNDNHSGDVWRWMRENQASLYVGQEPNGPAYGLIPTPEGDMRVDIGDWIIKDMDGGFRVCSNDLFHSTYEADSFAHKTIFINT